MLSVAGSDGVPRRARGALEAAIMDVLWRAESPLSPGEVRDLLGQCAHAEARPIAARVDPRWATWLLTGAAVALTASSGAALTLVALAALVKIPLIAQLGRWSPAVIDRGDPTSTAAAIIAGVLLGMALTAAV